MIRRNLFLAGVAILLTWGCAIEEMPKDGTERETTLSIKQEDTGTSYTFSVDAFIWEAFTVFQDDGVNEPAQGIWDSALLRWGFRKKPVAGGVAEEIYWVQKSKKDTENSYPIEVENSQKHLFVPKENNFPAALQSEDSENLEVYLQLQVGGSIISAQLGLPADFKIKLGIMKLGISASFSGGSLSPPAGNVAPTVVWDDANTDVILGRVYLVDTPVDMAATNYMEGTVNGGQLYRFSVLARDPDGDPLSYEWYLNGKLLAGETGGSVSLPIVSPTVGKTAAELVAMTLGDRQYMEVKVRVRDFASRQPVEISKKLGVNRNPRASATQNKTSIRAGEYVTFWVAGTDNDDLRDLLMFEWQYRKQGDSSWTDWLSPEEASLHSDMYTRRSSFQWPQGLPNKLDTGVYEVKFRVSDYRYGHDERIRYVRYTKEIPESPPAGNTAPTVIEDVASTDIRSGTYILDGPVDRTAVTYVEGTAFGGRLYRFGVLASDPDGDPLWYDWYLNGKLLVGEGERTVLLPIASPTVGKTEAEVRSMPIGERKRMSVTVHVRDFTSRQPEEVSWTLLLNRHPEVTQMVADKTSLYGFGITSLTVSAIDKDDFDEQRKNIWLYRKKGAPVWDFWAPLEVMMLPSGDYEDRFSVFWPPTGLNLETGIYELRFEVRDSFPVVDSKTIEVMYTSF